MRRGSENLIEIVGHIRVLPENLLRHLRGEDDVAIVRVKRLGHGSEAERQAHGVVNLQHDFERKGSPLSVQSPFGHRVQLVACDNARTSETCLRVDRNLRRAIPGDARDQRDGDVCAHRNRLLKGQDDSRMKPDLRHVEIEDIATRYQRRCHA